MDPANTCRIWREQLLNPNNYKMLLFFFSRLFPGSQFANGQFICFRTEKITNHICLWSHADISVCSGWTRAQWRIRAACCPVLSVFPKQPEQTSNTSPLRTEIAEEQSRLYLNPIDQVSDVTQSKRQNGSKFSFRASAMMNHTQPHTHTATHETPFERPPEKKNT